MAWPFTKLRTYIANGLPSIKAADLNSIQDYINHLFVGSKTVKGPLEADGTGDAAPTGAVGDVVASGVLQSKSTKSSATQGAGQTVTPGKIYKDTACFAWAEVSDAGALVWGANILSAAKGAGNGHYIVTLNNSAANRLVATVTCLSASGNMNGTYIHTAVNVLDIYTSVTTTGVATDCAFAVHIYGG